VGAPPGEAAGEVARRRLVEEADLLPQHRLEDVQPQPPDDPLLPAGGGGAHYGENGATVFVSDLALTSQIQLHSVPLSSQPICSAIGGPTNTFQSLEHSGNTRRQGMIE